MTPAEAIASLDSFLQSNGEDIVLRYIPLTGPEVDVSCRAKVDAASNEQIAAGISATTLNVILSPTQITAASWPGIPSGTAPFNPDTRIPKSSPQYKILLRGAAPRAIAFVDPKIMAGQLVRINIRISG